MAEEQVYLIGCRENTLVKIGRSGEVAERLAEIQRMSPVRLSLLWHTPGGVNLETRLHREFKFLRLHGEWFDFRGLEPVVVVNSFLSKGRGQPDALRCDGPLALDRSRLVWITTRSWPGPPVGKVRSIFRSLRGEWSYSVGDVRDAGAPAHDFGPSELRPCRLPLEHVIPSGAWPEFAFRSVTRQWVPGQGADL